jgi:hypothetical protein
VLARHLDPLHLLRAREVAVGRLTAHAPYAACAEGVQPLRRVGVGAQARVGVRYAAEAETELREGELDSTALRSWLPTTMGRHTLALGMPSRPDVPSPSGIAMRLGVILPIAWRAEAKATSVLSVRSVPGDTERVDQR